MSKNNNGRRDDIIGYKVLTEKMCSPLAAGEFDIWYPNGVANTMNLQRPSFFFLSRMAAEDWAEKLMQSYTDPTRWDTEKPLQVWSVILYRPSVAPRKVVHHIHSNLYNTFWQKWYGPKRAELENKPETLSELPEFQGIPTVEVPASTVLAFRFAIKRRVQ